MMPYDFMKQGFVKIGRIRWKALRKVIVDMFLLFVLSQFLSFNITSVRSQSSSLLVFAEVSSFARLSPNDPSGWFYQAVLYNPTDSDIVVTGLRWWYNASMNMMQESRNATCSDSRYFSFLPNMSSPDATTIWWEYAPENISIIVPAKEIIVTWIEVPTDSVNDDGILATYYVQAYVDGEWLSSPLYISHSGHNNAASTVFRADFDLTTDPNDEQQNVTQHSIQTPEWLFNEDRYVVAGLSTRVRLIPVTSAKNSGIDYATVNVTLPSGWSYVLGSAYNPYGETITPYSVDGKDRLEWDLDRDVLRYFLNQSMAQNYIEFNVTAPYAPGVHNFTVTSIITSLSPTRTIIENQFIYAVVRALSPPNASFTSSPTTLFTGENVIFNATASYDPDGQIVNYFWDFGDGNTDTGNITTQAYADNGTYAVTLTVTDNDGLNSTALDTIIVQNRPPIAQFTESAEIVDTDVAIYFNASDSYDLDGSIVDYFWNFGDSTNTTGVTVNHIYTDDGVYTVILTVTDDDGATASTNATKTILNRAPVASFVNILQQPTTNDTIIFNATDSYDPDGMIVNYTWNFGDGNITTTSNNVITHIYREYGDFNVTLTITDNDSYKDSTSQIINVHVHDVAIINATVSPTDVQAGQVINITVTAKNKGTTTESFNVTLFYNETMIGTQLISNLAPDAENILNFYWNTTGVTPDIDYTIKAEVTTVLGETDIVDNTYTYGIVKVKSQDSPPFDWNPILPYLVPTGATIVSFLVAIILKKELLGLLLGAILSRLGFSAFKKRKKRRGFGFFDKMTDGGIPDSFSVLISGEPGSGKSVLCQQLTHTFLAKGDSCLYITYDCFPDEIRENMEKFHWNVPKDESEGKLVFIDSFSSIANVTSKEKYSVSQPFSLSDLGITLSQAINEEAHVPRVFLDSIVPLFTHVGSPQVVEFLQDRSARIKGVKGTSVFTIGKETIEPNLRSRLEEIVDCVIELEVSHGKTRRRMRIKKIRGRKTPVKWIQFEIESEKGIVFKV